AAIQAFPTAGYYIDDMQMYDPGQRKWRNLNDNYTDRFVECRDDDGEHGNGVDAAKVYPRDGNSSEPWASYDNFSWSQRDTYTVYDPNWLNWYHNTPGEWVKKINVVKDVATALLDTTHDINVGLMRYNRNSGNYGANDHGGPVIHAVEDIATARTVLKETIKNLPADGNTPLAETMYEAARYY